VQTDSVYFVDRDPAHFQRILNFMRDGECVVPASQSEQRELLAEAAHYQARGPPAHAAACVTTTRFRLRKVAPSILAAKSAARR
jgi:BTB/POZ domain